jgi:hypothetical protein
LFVLPLIILVSDKFVRLAQTKARHDCAPQSVPSDSLDEFQRGWRNVIELDKAAAQFICDLYGYITRPSLNRVEDHDPSRVLVLTFHYLAHQRRSTSVVFGGFAPGTAEPTSIILEHKIDVTWIWMRHDGRRMRHDPKTLKIVI